MLVALNRPTVEAVADRLAETGYLDRAGIETILIKHPILSDSDTAPETT